MTRNSIFTIASCMVAMVFTSCERREFIGKQMVSSSISTKTSTQLTIDTMGSVDQWRSLATRSLQVNIDSILDARGIDKEMVKSIILKNVNLKMADGSNFNFMEDLGIYVKVDKPGENYTEAGVRNNVPNDESSLDMNMVNMLNLQPYINPDPGVKGSPIPLSLEVEGKNDQPVNTVLKVIATTEFEVNIEEEE